MKILFLTTALLAMTTAQAQSATPAANDAQHQQNIEHVFRGAELDRSIQVYPKAELAPWDRKQTNEKDAFREIGWLTLPPGASIGLHKHDNNEDVYIIISGQGIFTDSNGKETEVKAGDITIARQGQSHALKNAGEEPLVFLDLIAQTLPPAANPAAQ